MRKILLALLASFIVSTPCFALESLYSFGTGATAVTANHYIAVNSNSASDASIAKRRLVVAGPMTLSNLNIKMPAGPGVGTTINYTLYVNGSASTLVAACSEAVATCSDTTNSVSVVRGDVIALRAETGAGAPTYTTVTGYIKKTIAETNRDDYIGGSNTATILSAGTTNYTSLFTAAVNASEGVGVIATGGVVSKFIVSLDGSPGAGKSYAVTLRKNQVDTNVTCTVSDSATTCEDNINYTSFSGGDTVSVKVVPSGTPSARYITVGAKFSSSISGYFLTSGSATSPSTSVTHYGPFSGTSTSTSSTSTNNQLLPGGLYLVAYAGKVLTAPDNGAGTQSWTMNLRDQTNAVDFSQGCVISEAGTSCITNTRVALPASNWLSHTKHVPSGTPISSTVRTGMALTFNAPGTTTIKGY